MTRFLPWLDVLCFLGGDAKANTCLFDAPALIPPVTKSISSCTQGVPYVDWHQTNPVPTDKIIKFISGPTLGKGDIEWKWVDVNGNGDWHIPPDPHSVDEWHVDVDFNPDFAVGETPPPPAPHTSVFDYVVLVDKFANPGLSDYWFEDVQLGAIFGPDIVLGGPESFVTKDIYVADCTYSPSAMYDCTKGAFIDTLRVSANGPATDTTGLLPMTYD